MTPNENITSLIRTYVPYAVGAVLAWILSVTAVDLHGATEAAFVAFGIAVVQNVYYLVIRLAETRMPSLGVLLGIPTVPEYARVDNLWASVVRTGIPTIVGALVVTLASGLYLDLDSATQTGIIAVLTAVVQSAYYTIATAIEARWPAAKALLGGVGAPSYEPKHSA